MLKIKEEVCLDKLLNYGFVKSDTPNVCYSKNIDDIELEEIEFHVYESSRELQLYVMNDGGFTDGWACCYSLDFIFDLIKDGIIEKL